MSASLDLSISQILEEAPQDWLALTTHRLDIYNEEKAKIEFMEAFEDLVESDQISQASLSELPTAYDYIRLGHPLSSVLEWYFAKKSGLPTEAIISFQSRTMPLMAILRHNKMIGRDTMVICSGELPNCYDIDTIKAQYEYDFVVVKTNVPKFEGSRVYIDEYLDPKDWELNMKADFQISLFGDYGSIVAIKNKERDSYVSSIQHVRRRESIAMTPINCYHLLSTVNGQRLSKQEELGSRTSLDQIILDISQTSEKPVFGSSGLSVQYAIMMGLIEDAKTQYPGKEIRIIVPPNCYGGTNDQARRVAAAISQVEVMDLPVDGDSDMVRSTEKVLAECAAIDAIPLIIAEIPTNPRVEVPDMEALRRILKAEHNIPDGSGAVEPIFILDQTFCPNLPFLREGGVFEGIKTIAYVSGSKFPSGGLCTAGYCVANEKASSLMNSIAKHMALCDNQATAWQEKVLEDQMPSMLERITQAYVNTRDFVNFIEEALPEAKINFVSEELAEQGFNPSVFSLDLPTLGNTPQEREEYKRAQNLRLIEMMISALPEESKYCVSYGQLKGCYWTIPATSTQGTTKEADKDYIARVSVSPNIDLKAHKEVFSRFVEERS